MIEIWKDIPEWEDYYSVSNLGRVFSKKFNKIKAQTINNNGYPRVDLFTNKNKEYRKKSIYVHRLVALLFVEGYKEGLVVDHIDNDKTNNVYTNLRWVSQSENIKKAYDSRKGIKPKFVKQPVYVEIDGKKLYFDSMIECARSLGLPTERIKTVLRFYNGNIPELGLRVVRCVSND